MKSSLIRLAIYTTLAGSLLLTACAATQTASAPSPEQVVSGMQGADAKSSECITASVVGGLLGGMMAEGTNTAKGAAAGAGIAMLGCVAIKSNARQHQAAPAGATPAPTSTAPTATGTETAKPQ